MILFTSFENQIFKGLQSRADLRKNESRFSRLIARSLNSVSVCVCPSPLSGRWCNAFNAADAAAKAAANALLCFSLPSFTDSSRHSNSAAAEVSAASSSPFATLGLKLGFFNSPVEICVNITLAPRSPMFLLQFVPL